VAVNRDEALELLEQFKAALEDVRRLRAQASSSVECRAGAAFLKQEQNCTFTGRGTMATRRLG
jgi:hypothetical protein